MLNRFKSFDSIEAAGEAMLEEKEQIIGINQDQLYEHGIGNDGQPLPPYTAAYAKRKPSRGIVDIYKTGNLQSAMNLRVDGNEYEINSPVEYTPYVQKRRPTIFGLTEEGKRLAWFIIHDAYVSRLKEYTGTI
jgi:hypothetical protein